MAFRPTYDPNSLTGPDKQSNYGRLALDASGPLLNRAIKGLYQPGSTYKPIGALIGLDEGVITPASGISCLGYYYGVISLVNATKRVRVMRPTFAWPLPTPVTLFFYNTFRLEVDKPRIS